MREKDFYEYHTVWLHSVAVLTVGRDGTEPNVNPHFVHRSLLYKRTRIPIDKSEESVRKQKRHKSAQVQDWIANDKKPAPEKHYFGLPNQILLQATCYTFLVLLRGKAARNLGAMHGIPTSSFVLLPGIKDAVNCCIIRKICIDDIQEKLRKKKTFSRGVT